MSRDFRFKQFNIVQQKSPMKVGTDGVLLGAWCHHPNPTHILDIGTGTGLIALMLAQRYPNARITALEPNPDASSEARLNFDQSPWGNRIRLIKTPFQHFKESALFDLIVSNPPFFQDSLNSPDSGKNMARHTNSLQPAELAKAHKLLAPNGYLSGIYPRQQFETLSDALPNQCLHRYCAVRPTPSKLPHRILFEFGTPPNPNPIKSELVIESTGRHQYSEEYIALTRSFYLNF